MAAPKTPSATIWLLGLLFTGKMLHGLAANSLSLTLRTTLKSDDVIAVSVEVEKNSLSIYSYNTLSVYSIPVFSYRARFE